MSEAISTHLSILIYTTVMHRKTHRFQNAWIRVVHKIGFILILRICYANRKYITASAKHYKCNR